MAYKLPGPSYQMLQYILDNLWTIIVAMIVQKLINYLIIVHCTTFMINRLK